MLSSEVVPVIIRNGLTDDEAKYILDSLVRIGFQEDEIARNYLIALYILVYNKYKDKKRVIKDWRGWKSYVNYTEQYFCRITLQAVRFEVGFKGNYIRLGASNYLNDLTKSIGDYKLRKNDSDLISATDIASFVFCSASYCIAKTYVDDGVTEEAKIGIELHEQVRLVNYASGVGQKPALSSSVMGNSFYTTHNQYFFDDMRSSKIYYMGHGKNYKKYFKSSKGKFIGQPDYVFINGMGEKFIVEEKYRNIDNEVHKIRDSHNAQLASYILGLDELGASYGYLVYWYYTYESDVRRVKKCVVYKVERSEINQLEVRAAYKAIDGLKKGKALKFDIEGLNATKCASCSVKKFCGHKTGRLSEISIPYGKKYYGLI